MAVTKLGELNEKGGHKIQRRMVSEFLPFCALCKQVVWEFWLDSDVDARRKLAAHLALAHQDNEMLLAMPALAYSE